MTIERKAFEELPYVDAVPRDGRQIVMKSYYERESGEWILHLPHEDSLILMKAGETIRGSYYSRAPADPCRDLFLPLSTVTAMHLSFPGVYPPVSAIEADLHHFCSLLETYRILTAHPPHDGLADLLLAQFEALVLLIRQVFDHLQKVAQRLCRSVVDPEARTSRIIGDLPDSFARVVLHGDDLRSSQEIGEKFRLPEPISQFYEKHAARFRALRDLRVAIEHHGVTPEAIFLLEQGAGVIGEDYPWANLGQWPASFSHGKFVSLRGVSNHLIDYTLNMLLEFSVAFPSRIMVPPALSPGVQVFLRNPHGAHLVQLPAVLAAPWEQPGQ